MTNRSSSPEPLNDMVLGYMDGKSDDRNEMPVSMSNRSYSYRHGWMNGRDDRINSPRASAAELRKMAYVVEQMDSMR